MDKLNVVALCLLIMTILASISIYIIGSNNKYYQIVEKGKYSRIQYVTEDSVMTPEFIDGYYYVMRDGNTGKENRVEISEEEFEACVVGDVVERY